MTSMKASQFMDHLGAAFLNTVMLAAMPVALLASIFQSL